ncbi:MAG: PAS domain S-box protein [Chthoniobacteraceae bacterium]
MPPSHPSPTQNPCEGPIEASAGRKLAEKESPESEARFRAIFELAAVGVALVSKDGAWLDVNQRLCDIVGYTREELLGLTFQDITHPDDLDADLGHVRQMLAGDIRTYAMEKRYIRRGGGIVWIALTVSLVRETSGAPKYFISVIENITERKRTEEALRESEARLRMAVKAANIGLWDWDLQTNAVYFSPEWKSQIGYRGDELANRFEEWQGRVHPEDLDPVLRKLAAYFDNPQSPHEVELRLRHKDGSYRWIYGQGDMLRDAAGKPVRMLGCHIDVTERKRAEEAVSESEARYRRIVDTAEEGVWTIDTQEKISFVNPKMARMLGYTVEEILGCRLYDFMDDEARAEAIEYVKRRKDGVTEQFDFRMRCKDGSVLWTLVATNPIHDASGTYAGTLAMLTDITERKAADAALRDSEVRYRQLFDANPHPMWVYDLESLRFLAVNAAAIAHYGYSREKFLAMTIKDIRPPEDVPSLIADVAAVTEGLSERRTWRHRKQDGKLIHVETTSHVLDFDGRRAEVVLAHDITERLRSEARLLQAEDAERRRIAKELHDSTAQDLVAVTMNLGTLQELLPPGDTKAARLLADSIALLENSANDIRTLSYVLHPPRLDEAGLAGALAEYAAGFTTRTDTRIRVEIAPDFGRLPEDMEIVLFRVVQEGIANVLRHAGSDTATIRLVRAEGNAVLEVEDYGRGMADAGARGVGIAGMRERLQHLGGRIEIESDRSGTIVRAVLPLRENWK